MRSLLSSLLAISALSASIDAQSSTARIVIEPEFLVSRDGDLPHMETMVAANPRNPRNLIGGSIAGGRPGGGFTCKAYTSHDGGRSWQDHSFAELIKFGGGDPQIVFTPSGTAIFTCLAFTTDDRGRTRASLYSWRSEDGGDTWSSPAVDLGASYDHEMITADQTRGRFAGRVYMSALYGREYRLGLFRSADGGRTWTGPVEFVNGEGHGVNVQRMVVFSDGDLMATWGDFSVTPRQDSTWKGSSLWSAISRDGGVTFSSPRKVMPMGEHYKRSNPDIRLSANPIFAVDPSDRHHDRVYVGWAHLTADGPRAAIAYSDDKGETWSQPKLIDPGVPRSAKQFQVRIAVNHEGTLGVSFYDTRDAGTAGWHEWFSASIDGGQTFLAPLRVSNEVSLSSGAGNERLEPNMFSGTTGKDGVSLSFISGASRWSSGGDYLGMTVDSAGIFHPFWADARTGTFQLWTARIRVERPPQPLKPHPLDEFFPPDKPTIPVVTKPTNPAIDISNQVEFVFDPTVQNATTGEMELRIRLKNSSRDTIFGPLQIEVKGFGGPRGYYNADEMSKAPTILNATNGKNGVGAIFDFTKALGTDGFLPPGGQTSAVLWKLKLKDARNTPQMSLVVTGVLRTGK
jgi:hypothetical protein